MPTKELIVGTVVLARWMSNAKATKFPAVLKSILPKKRVGIEFYDGVETETEQSAVQTLEPELQKEVCVFLQVM